MVKRRRSRRRQRIRVPRHALPLALFAIVVVGIWLATRRPPSLQKPAPLTREQAREANASLPVRAELLAVPQPFRFHGTPAAREQAIQCLATAAIYEAGDDAKGQRAVMQVVLNRVARPGFPKTVCGVVYQGAGRPTGCQFSFTCDGSQLRRPEYRGWEQARSEARRMLGGHVDAAVGSATHYHTDWVVPYWIGSLDKVAAVGHHLFYQPKQPGG